MNLQDVINEVLQLRKEIENAKTTLTAIEQSISIEGWVSIAHASLLKGRSIKTIKRQIKEHKLQTKQDGKKTLIWIGKTPTPTPTPTPKRPTPKRGAKYPISPFKHPKSR